MKDFVRIKVGGRKYRWYYKKFMKRVLKGTVILAASLAIAYFMLDIALKAWDTEWDQRMKAQEEYIQKFYEQRIENGKYPHR